MSDNTPENRKRIIHPGRHGSELPARHPQKQAGGARGPALLIVGIVVLVGFFLLGMLPKSARNAKLRQRAKAASESKAQVPVVKLRPSPAGDLTIPARRRQSWMPLSSPDPPDI